MSYTVVSIFELARPLLNDVIGALYTDDVMLPYLKLAHKDLEIELDLNNCEINFISESVIDVAIGVTSLPLPTNFFLPINLKERADGEDNSEFIKMKEVSDINSLSLLPAVTLRYWDYRHNCVNLIGSTTAREVRLSYQRSLAQVVDSSSLLAIRHAENYYAYRTAALCAEFIGGNKNRADSLNMFAANSSNNLVSLYVKNTQGNRVRRKPFRVGGASL